MESSRRWGYGIQPRRHCDLVQDAESVGIKRLKGGVMMKEVNVSQVWWLIV